MTGKKILLIVVILVLVAGVAVGTVLHSRSDVPAVTTAKAVRQDLVSTVSGTGQIKPKTYVNVGATSFGRITHLYVKEGDHVKKGDSPRHASRACSPKPPSTPSRPPSPPPRPTSPPTSPPKRPPRPTSNEAKADLEQKKFDYDRAQALYKDKLIAKQDFDAKKAAYDVAVATLAQREAAARPGQGPDRLRARPPRPGRRQPARQLRRPGQDHQPRSLRRPRHQRPRPRGRNRRRRHPERRRLDPDDPRRHVRHHRRGQGR